MHRRTKPFFVVIDASVPVFVIVHLTASLDSTRTEFAAGGTVRRGAHRPVHL
jgi:hypothetical protein